MTIELLSCSDQASVVDSCGSVPNCGFAIGSACRMSFDGRFSRYRPHCLMLISSSSEASSENNRASDLEYDCLA